MNEKFSDELISAYLDGELTAHEQLQVELVLAENPQYQQMFEELRILRSNLQSLPSYQLDDQFADRVLRRAEKEMLLAPSDSAGDAEPPSVIRRQRSWRGIILSVASLAAMIMIGFFVVSQMPNFDDQLARTPESLVEEDQTEPVSKLSAVTSDADGPSSSGGSLGGRLGKSISKDDVAGRVEGLSGNARREMIRKSSPSNKGALWAPSEEAQANQGADKRGIGGGGAGSKSSNSPKPKQAASNEESADYKSDNRNQAKMKDLRGRGNRQRAPVAADEAPRPGIADKKSLVEMLPKILKEAEMGPYADRNGQQLADDLFVVTLTVTQQAHSSGALYKALQKHRILPQRSRALDAMKSLPSKNLKRSVQEKSESDAEDPSDEVRSFTRADASGEMDLIYVQANYQQVQAALNELKQQVGVSGLSLQSLSMDAEGAALSAAIKSAPVQELESATQPQPGRAGLTAGKKTTLKTPADAPGNFAPKSQSATSKSKITKPPATKSDSRNSRSAIPPPSEPSSGKIAEDTSNWPLGKYRRITRQALELKEAEKLQQSLLLPPKALVGNALNGNLAKKNSGIQQVLPQQPQAPQQAQAPQQTNTPTSRRSLDEKVSQRQNRVYRPVRVLIVVRTVASTVETQASEAAKARPKPAKQ